MAENASFTIGLALLELLAIAIVAQLIVHYLRRRRHLRESDLTDQQGQTPAEKVHRLRGSGPYASRGSEDEPPQRRVF